MIRWTIYDEIRQDASALDRLKDELLALSNTDLTEEQLAMVMRMALTLQTLRHRAKNRMQRMKKIPTER